MAERSGPLSHIRVLDLSRVMAGPWASQILADLGADVIKVERPEGGDETRGWGPPFLKDENGEPTSDAGYFLSVNRGKRSVCLDLKDRGHQQIVRNIAAKSDIVLENFKAGALARFGLDAKSLRAINPSLIYASITGFGQDGPRASQSAYDFMIQGMGGLMSVTGEADGKPGGGPQKVGIPIVDLTTGLYATIGVLAALARRDKTGRGETIDVAMLDVMTSLLSNQAMNYLLSGTAPVRRGNKHPNIQPQDVYPCKDGYIVLAVGNDGQFEKFAHAIMRPELSTDERFSRNASRVRNLDALNEIITAELEKRGKAHWIDTFANAGVPSGPINSIPELFDDPQVKHRGLIQKLDHALAGEAPSVLSPIFFEEEPIQPNTGPPALGQHQEDVLSEFGGNKDE